MKLCRRSDRGNWHSRLMLVANIRKGNLPSSFDWYHIVYRKTAFYLYPIIASKTTIKDILFCFWIYWKKFHSFARKLVKWHFLFFSTFWSKDIITVSSKIRNISILDFDVNDYNHYSWIWQYFSSIISFSFAHYSTMVDTYTRGNVISLRTALMHSCK